MLDVVLELSVALVLASPGVVANVVDDACSLDSARILKVLSHKAAATEISVMDIPVTVVLVLALTVFIEFPQDLSVSYFTVSHRKGLSTASMAVHVMHFGRSKAHGHHQDGQAAEYPLHVDVGLVT